MNFVFDTVITIALSTSKEIEMSNQSKKHRQLVAEMLKQVAPDNEYGELDFEPTDQVVESNRSSPRSIDQEVEMARDGLRSLVKGKGPDSLSDEEILGLEAIVMPRYRPVIDIINKDYASPSNPWQNLGRGKVKKRLKAAIPSIGRVEVPNHSRYPFAGTGFVVGDGLMMTNRHVAEIFTLGVRTTSLLFRPGQTAAIDFAKEIIPSDPVLLDVKDILAVHPHWDMAILKVAGLGDEHQKLVLDVTEPEDLIRAEKPVVVIGYPAQDVRNDVALQNQIFRGVFDVKRFQPGMLRKRENVRDSYGNRVNTITHDCSTLGGNSGSPVIDTSTGNVVALLFAG